MRLSKEEHTAIIAQLSYDLEPVTPLPDWNAIAMELVHLRNERQDMMKRLEEARGVIGEFVAADNLRETYHRMPNDKARIGDGKSPKARARDAWLKAFRRCGVSARAFLAGGE
jgi:Holliday junction resolvasome RuvABC endonuclease subunit